ncbi:MAG: DUF2589 domain-containing protein [Candidatus Aminicenantes bacterium]|jgi:hypothetical protein
MFKLDQFIDAIQKAVNSATDGLIKKNHEIFESFFETLDGADEGALTDAGESSGKGHRKLKPKTVTVQYPMITPDGPQVHDVQVPLITLVPVAMAHITEVKVRTELELFIESDELEVGFPPRSTKLKTTTDLEEIEDERSQRANTTLEITVKPSSPSQGLLKLIEGYEKALRAQIPG